MAFPDGIDTVECTVPYAVSAFDGEAATMFATLQILTDVGQIIWMETGQELTQMIEEKHTEAGDIIFVTPVTDQEGWRDSAGFLNPKWSVLITTWYVIDGQAGPKSVHWFRPLSVDSAGINLGQLPDGKVPADAATDYDPFWAPETADRKAGDAAIEASKIDGLNGVTGLWAGSQAEYDDLPYIDPNVVYIVE